MSTLADIIRTVRPVATKTDLKVARAKLRRYNLSGAGKPGGQGGDLIPVASELEFNIATVLNA